MGLEKPAAHRPFPVCVATIILPNFVFFLMLKKELRKPRKDRKEIDVFSLISWGQFEKNILTTEEKSLAD